VGFTKMTEELSPVETVKILNDVFSMFDGIADKFGVEKIKTIGDAYMVAGNLPESRPDHLIAMADLALEMHERVRKLGNHGDALSLRIGLNSGSVVAGVIGTRKFIYDVWGDTVNTASRLESHGAPGKIHVSEAVCFHLADTFVFEPRGEVDLKGRGFVKTYFLTGRLRDHTEAGSVSVQQPLVTQ
jgi:class 3 adenylate cyclase